MPFALIAVLLIDWFIFMFLQRPFIESIYKKRSVDFLECIPTWMYNTEIRGLGIMRKAVTFIFLTHEIYTRPLKLIEMKQLSYISSSQGWVQGLVRIIILLYGL